MNTDDLRALWDCVTRFHGRFFPGEPQPRSAQIRLLWEEVGEWYAERYAITGVWQPDYTRLCEEAADMVFVAFGMCLGTATWDAVLFSINATKDLYGGNQRSAYEVLEEVDGLCLPPGAPRPGYFNSTLAALILMLEEDAGFNALDYWHAAIATVITKNDAKTAEAGYRVNAVGKVTKQDAVLLNPPKLRPDFPIDFDDWL